MSHPRTPIHPGLGTHESTEVTLLPARGGRFVQFIALSTGMQVLVFLACFSVLFGLDALGGPVNALVPLVLLVGVFTATIAPFATLMNRQLGLPGGRFAVILGTTGAPDEDSRATMTCEDMAHPRLLKWAQLAFFAVWRYSMELFVTCCFVVFPVGILGAVVDAAASAMGLSVPKQVFFGGVLPLAFATALALGLYRCYRIAFTSGIHGYRLLMLSTPLPKPAAAHGAKR